jgi:hypothetical protein
MDVFYLLILPTSAFANPIDILARAFEISLNGGGWLNAGVRRCRSGRPVRLALVPWSACKSLSE